MQALYEAIDECRSYQPLDSPPEVGQPVLAQGLQRYLSFLGKGKRWLRAVVKAVIDKSVVSLLNDQWLWDG